MSETSSHLKSLLVSQVNAGREESSTIEYERVEQDTNQLIMVSFPFALHC